MRRGLQRGGGASGQEWRQSGLLPTQNVLRWVRQHEQRVRFGYDLWSRRNGYNVVVFIFRHSSLPRK